LRNAFDRRVVPEVCLTLLRECQARVACRLGGGAALSGAYLAHRLSRDLDLVCTRREDVRTLLAELPAAAMAIGAKTEIALDAGLFIRARVHSDVGAVEVDVVFEGTPDIEPSPPPLDGVVVLSLADLRAAKITCILSRSEPRDLVDLLFLDRAGYPPERDLALALRKDAGIDPGILAWLLGQFPVTPLPQMLVPLSAPELSAYRDALRERMRRIATGM
jgi:hypothetical protein